MNFGNSNFLSMTIIGLLIALAVVFGSLGKALVQVEAFIY